MLSIEVVTSLTQAEVLDRLKSYFLAEGLELAREDEGYLRFEGGGGFVDGAACTDGDTVRLSLFTREWEYHVKKFLSGIPVI